MEDKSLVWNSPLVRILRWVALVPVGLGILWGAEMLLNSLVDWALTWRLEGLVYVAVFVGGGLVLVFVMLFAGWLAGTAAILLAPRPKLGVLVLGIAFVVTQLYFLSRLFEETGVWSYTTMKFEFVLVVAVMLVIAYRNALAPEERPPEVSEFLNHAS